ncbi:MAG: hypothetical protein QXX32_00890 [Thermofilum sp.]|uniref:hypothetical protein n=1 Tax=Thermofilum sp. TaxID=1961369 RepID=UPI003162FD0F
MEENMKWFTVVKVPLLRVIVDRQVMLYTVTGRIEYSAFILFPAPHPSFIDKVLELIRVKDACVETIDEAMLFDYFTGGELPVDVSVFHAYYAFEFQWVKKAIPIRFILNLKDRFWGRERKIMTDATMETYSKKAEIVVKPPRPTMVWASSYDEEVTIDEKTFIRIHGIFTTERSPFIDKELEEQLKNLDPGLPYLPIRTDSETKETHRKRQIPPSPGYNADLLSLL